MCVCVHVCVEWIRVLNHNVYGKLSWGWWGGGGEQALREAEIGGHVSVYSADYEYVGLWA